jgi:hypothetical protein
LTDVVADSLPRVHLLARDAVADDAGIVAVVVELVRDVSCR